MDFGINIFHHFNVDLFIIPLYLICIMLNMSAVDTVSYKTRSIKLIKGQ